MKCQQLQVGPFSRNLRFNNKNILISHSKYILCELCELALDLISRYRLLIQ